MKKNMSVEQYSELLLKARFPFEEMPGSNKAKSNSPGWLIFFEDVIKCYSRISLKQAKTDVSTDDPLLILISPFMKVAIIQLTSDLGICYESLNLKCRRKFEHQLESKLVKVCKYSVTKMAAAQAGNSDVSNSHNAIENFVSSVYKKPHVFYMQYSVLARILSSQSLYWLNSIKLLIKRLLNDISEVRSLSDSGETNTLAQDVVQSIQTVQIGLSDPHENAQTVVILSFFDGSKVVYKPKSMMPEFMFNEFIDYLNKLNNQEEVMMTTLPVIDKGNYGWSKFVEHMQCSSELERERFYQRMGMFSAVLYMLRGTDYHHENIIACGEYPYLIDHEMLFYPIFIDPENKELLNQPFDELQESYYESVINTRMYPIVEKRVDGGMADVSAIGCYLSDIEKNVHLPLLHGDIPDAQNYLPHLLNGFSSIYKKIMDNKDELLAKDGILQRFSNIDFRFNLRATSSYLSINNVSVIPEALINGEAFCNRIHSVRVTLPSVFSRGLPQDVRLKELKILCRLDVPRFTVECDEKQLNIDAESRSGEIFSVSGYKLVKRRIESSSVKDLEKQATYIKESLNSN